MARISQDDLEYCSKSNECLDCYSQEHVTTAVGFQTRGKLTVPCCREHCNAYKNRINAANVRKYVRSSAAKRQARQCTYKGCRRKLIPQEVLPPWIRESTCGMHGSFKAFRVNRTAILRFIIEYCLTDQERQGVPQNIIYKPRLGLVFLSLQYPGCYQTKIFSARDLLQRYRKSIDRTVSLRSPELEGRKPIE